QPGVTAPNAPPANTPSHTVPAAIGTVTRHNQEASITTFFPPHARAARQGIRNTSTPGTRDAISDTNTPLDTPKRTPTSPSPQRNPPSFSAAAQRHRTPSRPPRPAAALATTHTARHQRSVAAMATTP